MKMVTVEEKTLLMELEHSQKMERERLRHVNLMAEIKALGDCKVQAYVRR